MPARSAPSKGTGDRRTAGLKLVQRGFRVADSKRAVPRFKCVKRVVGSQCERLTQARDGFGPLALAKSVGAAHFKRARVLEHAGHLTHQRIGWGDTDGRRAV